MPLVVPLKLSGILDFYTDMLHPASASDEQFHVFGSFLLMTEGWPV